MGVSLLRLGERIRIPRFWPGAADACYVLFAAKVLTKLCTSNLDPPNSKTDMYTCTSLYVPI